jgi:hypothetical protein
MARSVKDIEDEIRDAPLEDYDRLYEEWLAARTDTKEN